MSTDNQQETDIEIMNEESKSVYIEEYKIGLTIREISNKYDVSYESVRKYLKGKVPWRKKYISDFTDDQIKKAIQMFDDGKTVKEIAIWFEISGPAVSRLLRANNRTPVCSSRKYDILRTVPINFKQKQIIIGHVLGDGGINRDGPNSMYKIGIGQKKAHAQYFHWKVAMLDPFINSWHESHNEEKNSVMLQTSTICHQELKQFADMFYLPNRKKIVPQNIDIYMTPLALAVWIMDDGNLNNGVNMRICTQQFSYEDHLELQSLLKRCFDLRCKIMEFRYKGKLYYHLTLNKENTQKLSDIIRPHIVDCMKYKIMSESSTTTR